MIFTLGNDSPSLPKHNSAVPRKLSKQCGYKRLQNRNGGELEQTPGDSGGQRSLCVTVQGVHRELDMTELLSIKELNTIQVLSRTKVVPSALRPKISRKFPCVSPEPVMLRRLQLCGTCVSQPLSPN